MPIFPQPLLADLGTIIQAIILIVFLASGAVRMFRESQEAQKQAERRQQQRQRPRPEPARKPGEAMEARGAGQQQTPQEAIRSEVDEFLRRVSQTAGDERREQPRSRQHPERPAQRTRRQPRVEVLDEDTGFEVDERPRQSRRRQPQARPQRPSAAPQEPQSAPAGIERGATVAAHVAEHMKQGEFAERASHLGEDLAQTDERLEARLHEKFDHGLGSLSARRRQREAADLAQKGVADAPTAAEQLLDLLSTPQGVQQAIILNEVLQRPSDRW